MFRVIKEAQPTFIIAENVRGLINIQDGMVFETVCSDLESEGFEVQTFVIPAAGVGAPHKRDRVWIVGYSKHNGSLTSKIKRRNHEINAGTQERQNKTIEFERTSGSRDNEIMENSRRTLRQGSEFREKNENEIRKENADQPERSSQTRETVMANSNNTGDRASQYEINENREKTNERSKEQSQFKSSGHSEVMANTSSEQGDSENYGQEQREVSEQEQIELGGGSGGLLWPSNWEFEPNVGRVANGVPGRVHRLKALGNSIVPQIAEEIGRAIWKVTKNQN